MTIELKTGCCRDVLKTLPAQSVHCCVTSPPYFGLRDYGTAQWDGGDPECTHSPEQRGGRFASPVSAKQASNSGSGTASQRECPCGAIRIDNQIGLEPTPDAYVAELVAVFREVRRVLRDDGTLWLNLGDSYAGGGGGNYSNGTRNNSGQNVTNVRNRSDWLSGACLKPKDLIGIPWRVAFALQADGWYLRQDIIWSKPNPMPESVTDRCTKAHEYIFLMSKQARYFYDAAAIAEPAVDPEREVQKTFSRPLKEAYAQGPMSRGATGLNHQFSDPDRLWGAKGTRNKRSVWEVATQPFSEAHFATFPPDLIEPCIKAGCPKGGTVLDLFGGAGTTGLVADRLGRNALLIELNPTYSAMAGRRIRGDAGMFADIVT